MAERMSTVGTQAIGDSATAWRPRRCAEAVARTLPHDGPYNPRNTLAQPGFGARRSRRSLAGHSPDTRRSTLDPDRGYYGEAPASVRGGSRPVRGCGRSGRQPVRGQRLACLGRRPGSAVSTTCLEAAEMPLGRRMSQRRSLWSTRRTMLAGPGGWSAMVG